MYSKQFIKENFYFKDDDFLYFNHGTYGICPKPVLEEKIRILREMEENPVVKYSTDMFDGCLENTKLLADRIGANFHNLAIVPNVTTGMWSILQSMEVHEDEEILITNFTYEAVRMQVEDLMPPRGVVIRTLTLDPPFQSNEEIVDIYRRFAQEYPRIKYAIIDHIPSALFFVQPIKGIIGALRELGVMVIVDGAHTPGHLKDLDVGDIDADVYIGNLHKWYFAPRALGFIALREGSSLDVRPPIVSFLHRKEFYLRFIFMGTNDFSNILCLKYAFDFVDSLGGLEKMHLHIVETLTRGVDYLEKSWGVRVLAFPEMAPFVRLIPLPEGFDKHKGQIIKSFEKPFGRDYYTFTKKIFNFTVALVVIQDRVYVRLGCHVYVTMEHFVRFSERVLQWLEVMDGGLGTTALNGLCEGQAKA